MLKEVSIQRITFASIILFLLFLFSIFPKNEQYNQDLAENINIEYVSGHHPHEVYLLDSNNYVGRANILLVGKTTETKIRELIDFLIIDGKKESSIPNGFRALIPSDTKIIGLTLNDDGIVKINFSKEFLEIKKELEEKVVEALTYSLTSLKEVNGILIYVEGELLTTLPKSQKKLPSLLNRNYGINKVYDLERLSNINWVTIYYISNHNDNYYYVPVTKYVNDERDKIKIIIDELASGPIYETNLMSFLNNNTKLLNYQITDKTLSLNFNDFVLDDIKNKKILEEVIYSIALSIADNYKVSEVVFLVENEAIDKNVVYSVD